MKCTLIVFDMDGTILDTLDDLSDAVNFALTNNGLPQRSIAELKTFIGNGIKKLVQRSVPAGTTECILNKVQTDFDLFYEKHCYDKTRAYDGIVQSLRDIRGRGIRTAVVSNKDEYAVKILADRFFCGLFDEVCGVVDNLNKKPHPDLVNKVLKNLCTKRENAVYVGDSNVDYETAKNSRLKFIGAEWGYKGREFLEELGAKFIAKTPSDIIKIIGGEYGEF